MCSKLACQMQYTRSWGTLVALQSPGWTFKLTQNANSHKNSHIIIFHRIAFPIRCPPNQTKLNNRSSTLMLTIMVGMMRMLLYCFGSLSSNVKSVQSVRIKIKTTLVRILSDRHYCKMLTMTSSISVCYFLLHSIILKPFAFGGCKRKQY